ncbi:MAG TPA: hypothetical protein VFO93_13955 [Hymenobacter sp.]|uniref:hypothetical protein n=1 Tax=Hymenobacter sp. TaxID=1898978 RepID=UPI002D808C53|nr:hypothetical protein [Hymenobacter sp.]HET9504641.1 hypothetical protein [Hymenobacter sp.]
MNLLLSCLAGLLSLAAYANTPLALTIYHGAAPAVAFTVNGGKFHNQRFSIASPPDVGKRPGAAIGYWSQRPGAGTELDAKSEKPLGLLLHVPAAGRGQVGTFPLFAGAVISNGSTAPDITLTKGSVTITAYGARLVGTFTASGSYVDFAAGMKTVPVTISGGTFDLARGADR